MEISSFQSYLIILFVVLIIISVFVFRQFLRTRKEELNLVKFEQKGLNSLTKASELYEFGSIQIKKRLYSEATKTFLKAIEYYDNEPNEAKAIIENALGFSYAAQNEFKKAIKYYNSAIKSLPGYTVALNNLASAQQRLLEYDLAYTTYKKVLVIDPNNKTAIKKSKELEKRINYTPYKGTKDKGF
jgi:tetratricopeptide (TPR) repeat protein